MASVRRSFDEDSSISCFIILGQKPLREQNAKYIRKSSKAKMPASSPPAPGRISSRQGRVANSCLGMSVAFILSDTKLSC